MSYRTETRCIHGKEGKKTYPFGAVSVPICQTATFSHPGIGCSTGFDYSRLCTDIICCLLWIIRF